MIDTAGNVIDPETKQVISKNEPDFVPSKEMIEAQINAKPVEDTVAVLPMSSSAGAISLTLQIKETEKHLADLKVLRKQEIEKMKAELAELEAADE